MNTLKIFILTDMSCYIHYGDRLQYTWAILDFKMISPTVDDGAWSEDLTDLWPNGRKYK